MLLCYRYGRRSNLFKISCELQKLQEVQNGSSEFERDKQSGFTLNVSTASDYCNNLTKSGNGVPQQGFVNLNSSNILRCEPVGILPPNDMATRQAALAAELGKYLNYSSIAATPVPVPPVPEINYVANLSFHGLTPGFNIIQASQALQRIQTNFFSSGVNTRLMEPEETVPVEENIIRERITTSPVSRVSLSNPSSPNSLPPSSSQPEEFSNPPSPQSLPSHLHSEKSHDTSDLNLNNLPRVTCRKRPADSPVSEDEPIDLSIKRPKFSPSLPIPDLTPVTCSFELSHLATSSVDNKVPGPINSVTNVS